MHCASEEGDRLGHVPTTGTDGGNEAPGACCRVKTWPRVRNWDRGFSLARVFPYPRLPIWLMRRCLAKASKASYPGVPLRPFPGGPCECFSPPIHYDFGRSSGLALAARGAGGVRMTLTPTASSRSERFPNLTEPDRVAEFGALEEAREMCMASPELRHSQAPLIDCVPVSDL
jgi:hypothetical protein